MIKTLNLHQIYVTVLLIRGENSNKEEETKKINDSRVVLLSIFNEILLLSDGMYGHFPH